MLTRNKQWTNRKLSQTQEVLFTNNFLILLDDPPIIIARNDRDVTGVFKGQVTTSILNHVPLVYLKVAYSSILNNFSRVYKEIYCI